MITLLNAVRALPLWLRDFILNDIYRVDQNSTTYSHQIITGSIDATGYITGKKVGVAAYLAEKYMTSILADDTYTYVDGPFINDPVQGFIATTNIDSQPCIFYTEPLTQYFKIDAHASFQVAENDTTVTFAIRQNDKVLDQSRMSLFCKYNDEQYCLSGTAAVQLQQHDEIQIIVKADRKCEIIIISLTTTINEFFD